MFLLAGTAERRRLAGRRIRELAGQVDFERLTSVLKRQSLLPLIGTRLEELVPEQLPSDFTQAGGERVALASHSATFFAAISMQTAGALEAAGIPTVALKGPVLATEIYEHAGLREGQDVDLLVTADCLARGVGEVERHGWILFNLEEDWPLPSLHHVLHHPT